MKMTGMNAGPRRRTWAGGRTGIALCAALVALSCAGAAKNAVWTNNTPNTPDTAYDWSDSSNWQDDYVGGTEESDIVTISPSAKVYIRTPDAGVTVNQMQSASATSYGAKAIIVGDGAITLKSASGTRANCNTLAQIYCDVVFPSGETVQPYLTRACFCGRVRNNYTANYIVGSSSTVEFRFDRYAESAGETRTDDLSTLGKFGIGSTPLFFFAPVGADAVSGTWRLKNGSRYATRISSSAHALAVGTEVSASGRLPAGTFLKRVFDNATVELSEPAETSGDTEDVTLEFAAFTPDFRVKFPSTYTQHGNSLSCYFTKTREQDVARIEFGEFFVRSAVGAGNLHFGNENNTSVQGTLVFRKISGTGPFAQFNLRNIHFELGGDGDTGVTEFPANRPWTSPQVRTSRVTVTNNITGIVNVLTNFNGTIAKDGGGTLKIGLGDASNRGSFTVEGGTLEIMRNATVADGAALALESLSIASGASLKIPDGGLRVKTLSAGDGAILRGKGELTVTEDGGVSLETLRGISCPDGAKVRTDVTSDASDDAELQLDIPEAAVAGHPAFWLDASKPETVTTNESGGVLRWNDWREGEPMFCTNVASAYPTYVCKDTMWAKYVKIARLRNISELAESQMLVWSEPIGGIKAVFLVQNPTDGGGEILGRTASRLPWQSYFGSQDGPYYRGRNWNAPLVNSSSATSRVKYGRFYIDGVEVCGWETGYSGPFLQLVEHHVNTNEWAHSTVREELFADAFGFGYEQPHTDISDRGGMRISEYIIYTNVLSRTERLQTAQYLMRKWMKRNVYWSAAETNAVKNISGVSAALGVDEGKFMAASRVESGSIAKEGRGMLYVDGFDAEELDVRAGEVRVTSGGRSTEVPRDAVIHVDADDESTIEIYPNRDDKRLKVWSDVNGTGKSLRPVQHYAYASGNGAYVNAFVEGDSINGRTAINLGSLKAVSSRTSDGFAFYDAEGNLPPLRNISIDDGWNADPVQTAFFVYDSSPGGGVLLGGVGSQWPHKGMPRLYDSSVERPIFYTQWMAGGYNHQVLSNAYVNGEALFRRNGEEINPFTEYFAKNVERVVFKFPASTSSWMTSRKCDYIAASQDGYNTGSYAGGFKFGEIILYSRVLGADEISRVEAYLARKWSGIETPGYGASSADALNVAAGATLTVDGLPFETSALSGAGTVAGGLRLLADGTLCVEADAGGVAGCLTVTGTADLSSGGTVALGSAVLPVGEHLLLSAGTLSLGGEWAVSGGLPSDTYSVYARGGDLYLRVKRGGLSVLIR